MIEKKIYSSNGINHIFMVMDFTKFGPTNKKIKKQK
jgi:hypothetical protein